MKSAKIKPNRTRQSGGEALIVTARELHKRYEPISSQKGVFRGADQTQGSSFTHSSIDERQRSNDLEAAPKAELAMAHNGQPLNQTLTVLARAAQAYSGNGTRAAIFVVDAKGACLRPAAAADVAKGYLRAVDGFKIGPKSPSCGTVAYTGRSVIVSDVKKDPLWAPYLGLAQEYGIRACWSFPIISLSGRVLGAFALYHRKPKEPRFDEAETITLLARTAASLIERDQADAALLASQWRYRNLLDSIDEGFCIIELIFDESAKPVDYRFLETNPAFARQTGLNDATGKRMRELAANHEAHWFEMYGQVALTSKPVRFVHQAKALGERWFDAYAFSLGGSDVRKVGCLFKDITDRKQTEEALRQSYAELSSYAEEITRFNRVAVGRELRMIELKKEINDLCLKSGQPARYSLEFERDGKDAHG